MNRGRRKNGQFAKREYGKPSKPSYDKVNFGDHEYTSTPCIGDDNVCQEVFLDNCKSDWQASRHVVELDVLANGLKNCISCNQHLYLENCISCSTTGLAAVLSVRCVQCNVVNSVPTGKKHGNVFDMNTKLGTAILHSGVGERQLNSILCCLNIPPVSHTMLNRRVKESGRAVEQLAKESVDISLQNEVRLQGYISTLINNN